MNMDNKPLTGRARRVAGVPFPEAPRVKGFVRRFRTMTATAIKPPFGLEWRMLRSYAALLSGQVGRLVFSLVYFLALMKALTLAEFGLFATAAAIGVTLSRVTAFGFSSPLYRTACVRPRLLGSYLTGYAVALAASLPLCAGVAWGAYALLFSDALPLKVFAAIVFAEVVLWRTSEVLVTVANGQEQFLRGSLVVIAATALRALAAVWLALGATPDLETWSLLYLLANGTVFAGAFVFLLPRVRPRWRPRVWLARWRDALGVAGAELVFYAQSELDRVLVMALGGSALAGLYAIVIRLADFTAIPLRALMTLLIQAIMRGRGEPRSRTFWASLEGAIFLVSVAAMAVLAVLAQFAPPEFGGNVTLAAAFLPMAVLLPGFRNLVELHTELLYAFERPLERIFQLLAVGLTKAILLTILLGQVLAFEPFVLWLNAIFAAAYAMSAAYSYAVLATRVRPRLRLKPQYAA